MIDKIITTNKAGGKILRYLLKDKSLASPCTIDIFRFKIRQECNARIRTQKIFSNLIKIKVCQPKDS